MVSVKSNFLFCILVLAITTTFMTSKNCQLRLV